MFLVNIMKGLRLWIKLIRENIVIISGNTLKLLLKTSTLSQKASTDRSPKDPHE